MNFYSAFFDKFHVIMKPSYDLLQDINKYHWNIQIETLFQQFKTSNTKYVTLTPSNTNDALFITVDFSLLGISCVVFQMNDK